jgi:hypothetical protein
MLGKNNFDLLYTPIHSMVLEWKKSLNSIKQLLHCKEVKNTKISPNVFVNNLLSCLVQLKMLKASTIFFNVIKFHTTYGGSRSSKGCGFQSLICEITIFLLIIVITIVAKKHIQTINHNEVDTIWNTFPKASHLKLNKKSDKKTL